jgi:hypothetical protein
MYNTYFSYKNCCCCQPCLFSTDCVVHRNAPTIKMMQWPPHCHDRFLNQFGSNHMTFKPWSTYLLIHWIARSLGVRVAHIYGTERKFGISLVGDVWQCFCKKEIARERILNWTRFLGRIHSLMFWNLRFHVIVETEIPCSVVRSTKICIRY